MGSRSRPVVRASDTHPGGSAARRWAPCRPVGVGASPHYRLQQLLHLYTPVLAPGGTFTMHPMVDPVEQATTDLEALIVAARECEQQLHDAIDAYGLVLTMIRDGSPIRDALAAGGVTFRRRAVTEVVASFESARRTSRISLIRADLAEGAAMRDVAATWGVSRQLHPPLPPGTGRLNWRPPPGHRLPWSGQK